MKTRSRRRLVLAGVMVSCLLAAACSEDRVPIAAPAAPAPAPSDPLETAAVSTVATDAATTGAPATSAVAGAPADTAGTAAETTPETTVGAASTEPTAASAGTEPAAPDTTAAAPTGPTFGDLPWPCGPAEAANTDDGSEPGVTAEQIVLGYGDDAGFTVVPGLNHEASDGIEAMVAACNELGGINGRQIVANYYDSKLTEVTAAVLRACSDQVFFLVGTAWAFDEQQEEIRQSCGLPAVPTYSVSGAFAHAPMMFQATPNPTDEQNTDGLEIMAELFPEEVQSAGVLAINIGAVAITRDKILAVADTAGWNFVTTDITSNPMGENDWTPFVDQLQSAGSQVVFFGGQCEPMLRLFAQTASLNGYEPILFGPANLYEPRCSAENADGTLNNLYVQSDYVPMFEADSNKATQDYLEAIEATGGDVSSLGMQAASGFLLWATAADACGATLTRQCVLDNLAATHEWTGGGLHSASDPGGNHPPGCTAIFKVEGTEYVRVSPEAPATFECGEGDELVPTELPDLDALLLDENRVSHLYSNE